MKWLRSGDWGLTCGCVRPCAGTGATTSAVQFCHDLAVTLSSARNVQSSFIWSNLAGAPLRIGATATLGMKAGEVAEELLSSQEN